MRIVKEAIERKNEILNAAEELFSQKGFDRTSISDIIEKVGIARGTLYYHFKSKEDILDALIERRGTELLSAAKKVAEDKSMPVLERLMQTLMAMNADKNEPSEITKALHKPQNALMHQKSHKLMLKGIPPILMTVVEDGMKEGLFNTLYPYESLEMVIAHVNIVFDDYEDALTMEELLHKIRAFIFNLERLFGAKTGSFDGVLELFHVAEDDEDA